MPKLLNVRLSDEEAAMAEELRRAGVTVSSVVRSALRDEYSRRRDRPRHAAADLLELLHEKHPAPAGYRGRAVDATDRRQVASFLASRVRRRRSARV